MFLAQKRGQAGPLWAGPPLDFLGKCLEGSFADVLPQVGNEGKEADESSRAITAADPPPPAPKGPPGVFRVFGGGQDRTELVSVGSHREAAASQELSGGSLSTSPGNPNNPKH